jgi:hypothetical protein
VATATPAAFFVTCPRCKFRRSAVNIDGGTLFRCSGCEWSFTMSTQSPTGTTNATRTAGQATIPVASGGASFTSGMVILIDTGVNAEVVTATATGSATSIPVTPFGKAHGSGVAVGQLLVSPTYSGVGVEGAVPVAPGYGF